MKNRLPHIMLLQTFAFLIVVLGHAISLYSITGWYGHWHIVSSLNAIHDFIYLFHMQLFFFISGYLLFYTTKGEIKWWQYNKKRFFRLVVPFYVAGIFYYAPMMEYINPILALQNHHLSAFIKLQSTGHLWFLLTLFCISLIFTTLLKTPLRNYPYILLALFVIALYNQQNFYLPEIVIKKAMQYGVYFCLGYIISFYLSKNKICKYTYIFVCLLSVICYKYHFNTLFVCSFILFLYFLFYELSNKFPNIANLAFIKFISTNMLILYILHEPIMLLILKHCGYMPTTHPYIGALFLFVMDLLITINIVYIYRLFKVK